MEHFFFIANQDDSLVKIYFTAYLTNLEYINYIETLNNIYKYSSDENQFHISTEIKQIYTSKVNSEHIFFKYQFKKISFINSDYPVEDIQIAYDKSSIFFLKKKYDIIDIHTFDKFRKIFVPYTFIKKIDLLINKCSTYLTYIETNYRNKIDEDLNTLKNKNRVLLNPMANIKNLDTILGTIKKREEIEYMLFEFDITISNSLVNLYKLKYINIGTESVLDINESLLSISSNVTKLESIFNSVVGISLKQ